MTEQGFSIEVAQDVFAQHLEDLGKINYLAYTDVTEARMQFLTVSQSIKDNISIFSKSQYNVLINFSDAVLNTICLCLMKSIEAYKCKGDKSYDGAGYIYFIENSEDKSIKIGYSTYPPGRLEQLQTSCSAKLTLLATKKGKISLEKKLHKEFSHLRIRGEWFNPGADLLTYICKHAKMDSE